jgi:TolB protein
VDTAGAQGNSGSYDPSISADGRTVAFTSEATNLVTPDVGGWCDIFVRSRAAVRDRAVHLPLILRSQ